VCSICKGLVETRDCVLEMAASLGFCTLVIGTLRSKSHRGRLEALREKYVSSPEIFAAQPAVGGRQASLQARQTLAAFRNVESAQTDRRHEFQSHSSEILAVASVLAAQCGRGDGATARRLVGERRRNRI
jgi:hypothetical protein